MIKSMAVIHAINGSAVRTTGKLQNYHFLSFYWMCINLGQMMNKILFISIQSSLFLLQMKWLFKKIHATFLLRLSISNQIKDGLKYDCIVRIITYKIDFL